MGENDLLKSQKRPQPTLRNPNIFASFYLINYYRYGKYQIWTFKEGP